MAAPRAAKNQQLKPETLHEKAGKKPTSCGPGPVRAFLKRPEATEAILLLLKPRIKLCIDNK